MTLKEFSAEYLPLPESKDFHYKNWRKVFPTELRIRKFDKESFWGGTISVIEEQWERIHKGEVIDREWRELEVEDETSGQYER